MKSSKSKKLTVARNHKCTELRGYGDNVMKGKVEKPKQFRRKTAREFEARLWR